MGGSIYMRTNIYKAILTALVLLLTSCNVTIIYVEKTVYLNGKGDVVITGSELKDNQASQSADGKLSVPLVP